MNDKNKFDSAQEAIEACETECTRLWNEFFKESIFEKQIPQQFHPMVYQTFRAGYMSGIQFVSENLISRIRKELPTELL